MFQISYQSRDAKNRYEIFSKTNFLSKIQLTNSGNFFFITFTYIFFYMYLEVLAKKYLVKSKF